MRCTLCKHAQRTEIDKAIVSGMSVRDIARRFGVGKSAADRHRPHITKLLKRDEVGRARTLGALVARGHVVVEEVLEMDDAELRLKAVDRLVKLAELEFGTKSKVETMRQGAASPDEERTELARLKADIEERERELAGKGGGLQ